MTKSYANLCSRTADIEPVGQFEQHQDSYYQNEGVNGADEHREIKLDEEMIRDNCADCTEEIKVIKQEIREIKSRTDKLFQMVENIMFSNDGGKIK